MLENRWLSGIGAIYCSAEQKAIDGAAIMSEVLGVTYTTIPDLGENDRSATGYLSEAEFESVVGEFFRKPEESVRGWERAIDAQRRIISAGLLDGQAGRRQRCHRRAWRGWSAASVPSRRRAD